jgi:hypothetical protein
MEDILMNIVELEAWRKKEDNRDRELLEAFFAGAENSVHAKDPNRPGEKGTLARFYDALLRQGPCQLHENADQQTNTDRRITPDHQSGRSLNPSIRPATRRSLLLSQRGRRFFHSHLDRLIRSPRSALALQRSLSPRSALQGLFQFATGSFSTLSFGPANWRRLQ